MKHLIHMRLILMIKKEEIKQVVSALRYVFKGGV